MNGKGEEIGPGGRRIPLRVILLAVVGSFIAIGAAMWLGAIILEREVALHDAERDSRTLAGLLDQHAQSTLDAANLMLSYLAHVIDAGAGPDRSSGPIVDWGAVRQFAESMPQLAAVWVIGPDGRLLFASAQNPPPPDARQELTYFATPGTAAEGIFVGRLREFPEGAFFTIAKGVVLPGGTGTVLAAISAAPFLEFYRGVAVPDRSFVALMHADGAVVATPWPSRMADPQALAATVATAPSGSAWTALAGEPYVVAWRQLRYARLTVVAAMAESDALQEWYGSLERTGLMGLGAAAILGAITSLALSSLRREEESRAKLDRALRDKETLFKELHHRVKNNLQVVTSLITMQSLRFPQQPELQESFRQTMDRVRAMGLVHELLYQQEVSERLDFGTYLAALLRSLAESHGTAARGVTVSCEADAIAVDLNAAIPAALIVNELLTNALKYAFPDGRPGHVRVSFRHDGRHYVLVVADDGVGTAPGPALGTGLGTLIVKNLADQLGADYSVETSAGAGTRVSISFPCPS